jgi:outer membrane protein OmpA-like peptidoglycan-associated protein
MKKILISLATFFACSTSHANIVGTDFHNFNPTSSGLDFVTVHSSDTLEPGLLNLGTFLTFSSNSLPYFVVNGGNTSQTFSEPNDRVFAAQFHFGLGLMQGWDIGVSAVNIFAQSIDDTTFLGTYNRQGIADVRINSKFRLLKTAGSGLAMVLSVDKERVANNPYTGLDPGLTYNADLVFDTMLASHWRWGLNLGYRLRDSGEPILTTGITPMDDQFTFSSALSYAWVSLKSHLIFEIFGSIPTVDHSTPTDRELSNLQGLVGWRWHAHKSFDVHFGGGTEFFQGLGTPDILLYAGVNWRPGFLWKEDKDTDQDGVMDDLDQCPMTRPEHRQQVDASGCYLQDSDQDGVLNEVDRCPDTPIGEPVNEIGCAIKKVTEIKLENLNFKSGTAQLVPSSEARIEQAVQQLQEIRSEIRLIIVEGHTDSTGGEEMNQRLSEQRAETVRSYLVKNLGLEQQKVEAKGFGETQPVASNETQQGRLQNRRVVLQLIRY